MTLLVAWTRNIIVAAAIFFILLFIVLSQGWHTPAVNHFLAPYKVQLGLTRLSWFPLELSIEALQAGEGASSLVIEQVSVRTGLGFLTGDPIDVFIQIDGGRVGYGKAGADDDPQGEDFRIAGMPVESWLQLFRSPDEMDQRGNDEVTKSPQWVLHLNSLQISNFIIQSEHNGLPEVRLQKLLFGPLKTDAMESRSSLQVMLETAGGRIGIKGALSPMAKQPSAVLDLQLSDLEPNHQWLAQIPDAFQGRLDSSLIIDVKVGDRETETAPSYAVTPLSLNFQGGLRLQGFRWSGSSAQGAYEVEDFALRKFVIALAMKDLAVPEPEIEAVIGQLFLQKGEARLSGGDYALSSLDLQGVKAELPGVKTGAVSFNSQQISLSGLAINQPEVRLQLGKGSLVGGSARMQPNDSGFQRGSITADQWALSDLGVALPELSLKMSSATQDALVAELLPDAVDVKAGVLEIQGGEVVYSKEKTAEDNTLPKAEGDNRLPDPVVTGDTARSGVKQSGIKQDNAQESRNLYGFSYEGEALRLKDYQISYQDQNLKEAAPLQVELKALTIDRPRYPSESPFPFDSEFWLNGQSHWQLGGQLQTTPLKLDLDIDQKGLNLPDISAYSHHYAETIFNQGVMDNRIRLQVSPERLNGRFDFDFSQLDIKLTGSQASLNLPLNSAFALLEDSDNKINLSIELKKKGDELKVGTRDLVRELLVAASQKGTVAYLKYALQPFGALLTLKDVGSSLMKQGAIPLEPVFLQPLQAEITGEQQEYAQKVIAILREKARFKLNYCYLFDELERDILISQLKDPAKVDAAVALLNQTRLTQWRKLFAREGLADRITSCSLQEQDRRRASHAKSKSTELQNSLSRITLFLQP